MNNNEICRLKVRRFDPDKNPLSFLQDYTIPFVKENTILDALYYIYCNIDGTLAFRGSCFEGGYCNVCTVKVNDRLLLPCKHFMEKEMLIEPLPGYQVLRDLIVDYSTKKRVKRIMKK